MRRPGEDVRIPRRRAALRESEARCRPVFGVAQRKDQLMTTVADRASPGMDDPRVALAGERTLLAWVRTGLAMMGFGFVVARFGLFLHEIATTRGLPARPTSG